MSIKKLSYYYVGILLTYFTTKIFWDTISFNITEYFSLGIIFVGFILFITRMKRSEGKLLLAFALFSVYIILNGFILVDIQHFVRGIYEYIFYGLLFFSSIGFLKKIEYNQIEKLWKTLGYIGVILSLLTFFEYFSKTNLIKSSDSLAAGTFITGYGYTFRAKVFSRSYLSHGLIMGVFSLIELENFRKYRNNKWLVFYFLCLVSVLFTSSRGPLVATLISSLLFIFLNINLKGMGKKQFFMILIASVIGFIMFYIIFLSDLNVGNDKVMYFITRMRNIFNWNGDAGNLGRLLRWSNYLSYFNGHNIFWGVGISTTGSSGLSSIMGSTESGVLKRLIELGYLGFIFYYIYLFKVIHYGAKGIKISNSNSVNEIKKISLSIIVCILIDDIALQITEEIMISFLLYFFCALLFVCTFYYDMNIKGAES